MVVVAIIPARGGSKRIPRKNIAMFNGHPMITYAIRAAQTSECFDKIIVSTDSPEIQQLAESLGAWVPFMRPDHLADDHTATAPVMQHAVQALAELGCCPEHFCCIYPTTPLLEPRFIREGLQEMTEHNVNAAFSVTTFPFPIFRGLKVNQQGTLEMLWPEYEMTRSNDLPETYHDAGQFYWLKTVSFLQTPRMYTKDARPVVLPRHLVQDIDTPEDWRRAELLHRVLQVEQAAEPAETAAGVSTVEALQREIENLLLEKRGMEERLSNQMVIMEKMADERMNVCSLAKSISHQ
jgi:pseudaminic acid cytidylyltransferase